MRRREARPVKVISAKKRREVRCCQAGVNAVVTLRLKSLSLKSLDFMLYALTID